jgi:nucleotide-binding universal stress UspA family protein
LYFLPKNEGKCIGSVKGFGPGRRFSGVASRARLRDRNDGRQLVLLNVQNISAMDLTGAVMGSDWQEAASQASAKALKEAIGKAEAAGIAFKNIVRTGQTAEAIAQAARDESIEHIVMGTRGLGSIQGLLLGSVAMKVIHLAEVPITLLNSRRIASAGV